MSNKDQDSQVELYPPKGIRGANPTQGSKPRREKTVRYFSRRINSRLWQPICLEGYEKNLKS